MSTSKRTKVHAIQSAPFVTSSSDLEDNEEPDRPAQRPSCPSNDTSRPSTRDNDWAVTQQFPYKNKAMSAAMKKQNDPLVQSKMAAAELAKRHPAMLMPKLNCLKELIGSSEPDPEKILRDAEVKQRDAERRVLVKKKRRMYYLSQANAATAQRIMDKHKTDLRVFLDGPDIADVIAVEELLRRDLHKGRDDRSLERPWLKYIPSQPAIELASQPAIELASQPAIELVTSQLVEKPTKRHRVLHRRPSSTTAQQTIQIEPVMEEILMPLHLDELTQSAKVLEAKCPSTLWNNYLR